MTVSGYGMHMVFCGTDELQHRYRGRIEKYVFCVFYLIKTFFRVKFGVPINEAFAHDIPATLLVSLLFKMDKSKSQRKNLTGTKKAKLMFFSKIFLRRPEK